MGTENRELTYENLIVPYERDTFSRQLIDVGISEDSIESILETEANDPDAQLHMWLHDDIRKDETEFRNGERFIQFSGIYITDRKNVLLESDPLIEWKGYGMGGLLSVANDPAENALNEISEETPLEISRDRLYLLGETQNSSISPKLPGVMSHRDGYMFLYVVDSLEGLPETHYGSDGQKHDLMVIPIEDVLDHEEVDRNFKRSVTDYDLVSSEKISGRLEVLNNNGN
jgi:8-oxo-dGTP pyrophosphatase MutT (NUDIX family)